LENKQVTKPKNIYASLAVILTVYMWSICPVYAQDIGKHCASIAEAAVEAGKLRDGGMDNTTAMKKLAGSFSDIQVEAGVNSAYAYKRLREFALYDFVEAYCRVMVPTGGKVSDFARLSLKVQYDRSVECAEKGDVEKRAFLECWNDQVLKARQSKLGMEYSVKSGGYSFRMPAEFTLQKIDETKGSAFLTKAEAYLNLSGGRYPKLEEPDQLVKQMVEQMQSKVVNRQEQTIAGFPAVIVNVENMTGTAKARIAIVSISPNQIFIMSGGATSELWEQSMANTYENVLGAVRIIKLD
jgi:hypothetical protein